MAWYDFVLILAGLVGIFLVLTASYHNKNWIWGWILVLAALITKVGLWLFGLL